MSCMVSIVPSAKRLDFEESALLDQKHPVREQIFAMDAYPRTHLHFIVAVEFSGKFLPRCNVKRSLLSRMTRMQMRLLVAFPEFGAHRDENSVEQRQRCHSFIS